MTFGAPSQSRRPAEAGRLQNPREVGETVDPLDRKANDSAPGGTEDEPGGAG
jgi:hypothetical protein